MSRRAMKPFLKRKESTHVSSREVLDDFDFSMASPECDSGSLYDQFKDPSRDGASCQGMRSFKKRRTDSGTTDLTNDSDSEESPLVVVLLESAGPTVGGRLTEGGWFSARHRSLMGGGGRAGGGGRGGRGGGGGGGRGGGGGGGGGGRGGGGGGRGRGLSSGGRGRGVEGGGGGREGVKGRGRVKPTQGKISDFVSSLNGSGSHAQLDLSSSFENSQRPQFSSLRNLHSHSPHHSSRDHHFVPSMESSLPPLQSWSPRKWTQRNQDAAVSTRCTVATMNYPQQPLHVEGGARQRVANEVSPNMRRTRNFERRSTNESRHSGSSSDDVVVIESPSDDKQHCPLPNVIGTSGADQEVDVRRSSRSDRRCDSTQLSHQHIGKSGTRARSIHSTSVGGGSGQGLELESDRAVFSSPVQSHRGVGLESGMAELSLPAHSRSSGNVKQSNADQVGGGVTSGSAVSVLQQESVGQKGDGWRKIADCSPIERLYYEMSPGLQCTDGTSSDVGPSDSPLVVSKPDSAGGSDVVCIGSDGEDNCSYETTTSAYFESKKKERSDQLDCSIVSQQNRSSSSGAKGIGVPLSNTLIREQLRSSTGHATAASQSIHPLSSTPSSSGLSEACKRTPDGASSNRDLTSTPNAGRRSSRTTTDHGSTDGQFDAHQSWFDSSSPLIGTSPLPASAKGRRVSASERMREGLGQSALSEESHCDVSLVEVRDRGTDSDDDFEKPKKKHRNRFAISEGSRREKPLFFSPQSRATHGDTPSRPSRKEGSILETSPCSKPEERSVFDHLPRGNQRENTSSLIPPPLTSSPRPHVRTSQRKKSTSDDEVVFQGEEMKKVYPLRNKTLSLPSGRRDWYTELSPPSQRRGTGFTSSNQSSSSSNTSSFYRLSLPAPSYGKSMVAAAKQKGKGGLPQGYLKSLNSVQVPKLKRVTANDGQRKRKIVPRAPTNYSLKDELDNLQMDVSTAQVGRLDKINTLSPAELVAEELKLNLDINDKTHKMMIKLTDIAEWKMNLSSDPMLVALTLREGPGKQLANRLSTLFHLDSKFYNPKSKDESEKFVIFRLADTPPPKTIVQLNEILDGAKASCYLTMTIDKELDPTEATELLKRVQPSKPARTSVRIRQLSDVLTGPVGTGVGAPRRSSRVSKKRKGEGLGEVEEVVRRRKGDPNKKLLSYKPAGSKLNLEIVDADLDCLCHGEYLNDKIIDFYLMYLYYEVLDEGHRNRVHIFSSFFHTRLKDSSRDNHELSTPERIHDRVKTWTRHVDLFSKDYIVLPVCDRAHWFIAFICNPGLFNPDNVLKHQPRSKRVAPTRNKRGRTASKRGKKPPTPKDAIVLDSSQEELGAVVGGDEEEAPLPKNDREGCEGGEGEGMEGDDEVDMVEVEEFSDGGDGEEVVERGEGVVPGAVLQDAAEREAEEMEWTGCATSAIAPQGLEDSLDDPDTQMPPDSEMEVGRGGDDSSEDGVPSVRRNGHTVCRLDSESEEEEGVPPPHTQDVVTLTEADNGSLIKVERTEEEEGTTVSTSSSLEDTTKEPCILVLDSLGVRRIGIVKRIREYLTVEWRTKKKDLPLKEFDVMRSCYPKVLMQDNSSDCGLFVLQYVESLFTSIKEDQPLPSTAQAWADYPQTNIKRDIIRTIILDLSEKQSQSSGTKPTV